jgi:hypothetical protein
MKSLFFAVLLIGSQSFAGQFAPPVTNSVQYQMYGTIMEMPTGVATIYNLKMKSRTTTNGKIDEKFWSIGRYSDLEFLCKLYGYKNSSVADPEVNTSNSNIVELTTTGVSFKRGPSLNKVICYN